MRRDVGRWPQCAPPHHLTPDLPLYILKAVGLAGEEPSDSPTHPTQAPGTQPLGMQHKAGAVPWQPSFC